MLRRILVGASVLAILTAGTVPASAGTKEAPTPLTPANVAPKALQWEGTLAALGQESYWFIAKLGNARRARVTTWIHWTTSEDLAVTVLDASGKEVRSVDAAPGEDEIASYDVENGKPYEVRVTGSANLSTAFQGFTWVKSISGRNISGPGRLKYPKKEILALVDVPINVVFVGFDPEEAKAREQIMRDQLPPAFRPVIRTEASTGGTGLVRREFGKDGRRLLELTGSELVIEPMEYRYEYKFITTPKSYTRRLFAAAKNATSSGEYQLPFDRDFIERYNARAAALRGPEAVVAPGSPIDFIDGFSLEDWVAKNPPAGLDFDLSKPAKGYTYFVIDSFRPSFAGEYFNLNRYHNFRVMNELTKDPDSGSQNGFDWGRVWGGRYRFLMLDVGAAPNGWEAPVTLANTKIFRLESNGDSSAYDPPIWHYGAGKEPLESFYDRLGEDVQYAIWMRFTRGYLYRPRAYDKFMLAANTWHDFDAYTPWPSKLEMLYKDDLVLKRYKEFLPYVEFESFSRFKYLSKGDPEQEALDAGKNGSVSRAPVPFTVNTNPTMLLIDRNRPTYAPLEPGAFTIPIINVVFPSLYTWVLPAVVGGVAEGQDGDAWGQLQNVNNRTKWPGASATVKDSRGAEHAPTVPDARKEGIDNIARFGFTSTALHEAGHFLGLSHNHDAVAYEWRFGSTDKPEGYYDAVDWMYTTTATPMGYGWEYNRFEVMDKDNAWIGHTLEWLTEAQDNLADAYGVLDQKGFRSVPARAGAAQVVAEATIAQSVYFLRAGDYLSAVITAREARNASRNVVVAGAVAVLGTKVKKPVSGGGPLPATGVGDGAQAAAVLLGLALALGARISDMERRRSSV